MLPIQQRYSPHKSTKLSDSFFYVHNTNTHLQPNYKNYITNTYLSLPPSNNSIAAPLVLQVIVFVDVHRPPDFVQLKIMNDLLTDSFVNETRRRPSRDDDLEMGIRVTSHESDQGIEGFNKQIQDVEKLIDKITILLKRLKDSNEESKAVTKASAMKSIKKKMEKDVDEVGKIARNVKIKLEAINKDNLANRRKPGCEKGTGIDRSRTNLTNAITKKFRELLSNFQTLRQKIQDEYREVVERRVITVTGNRPDAETIDRLIETRDSEQIFQNAIQEMGRGQVLDTLEEIQERHDAVKEIEKKLLDLHQIYLDMSVLVEAQGEILDNIEDQVKNTVDHVTMGNDALRTAKSLQKKSRKCTMIAILILLIIAIVIVLSILKPWKK